jgi:hypothetical protein
MVSSGNHELGFGHLLCNAVESFDHELETLIRSPFPEGENAVDGSTTSREVGELRPAREDAMRPQVNVVPAVFVVQDLAVAGHEDRDGIREQQHAGRKSAGKAIQTFVTDSGVLEFYRIHQMVQCDVRVTSAQACQKRCHQAGKSDQGVTSERAEQKIEPDYVGFQLVHGLE